MIRLAMFMRPTLGQMLAVADLFCFAPLKKKQREKKKEKKLFSGYHLLLSFFNN